MLALLKILGRPLIEVAVTAFGRQLFAFLQTWRAEIDAKALGRAEAVAEAAQEAASIEQAMGAVTTPERDELLRRLREGDA